MTILDIHDELYNGDTSSFDTREVIDVYERHKELIEATEPETRDYLFAKVSLLSDYAYSLAQEKRYSNALPYLDLAIQLWEVREIEWSKPLNMIQRYENLRFLRGITLSHLKKSNDSKREFEWLVQHYPQNELYANWLNSLKKQRINRLANIAIIIAFVGYLPRLFFGDSPTADIGWLVFQVFFVIYLGLLVYVYVVFTQNKN